MVNVLLAQVTYHFHNWLCFDSSPSKHLQGKAILGKDEKQNKRPKKFPLWSRFEIVFRLFFGVFLGYTYKLVPLKFVDWGKIHLALLQQIQIDSPNWTYIFGLTFSCQELPQWWTATQAAKITSRTCSIVPFLSLSSQSHVHVTNAHYAVETPFNSTLVTTCPDVLSLWHNPDDVSQSVGSQDQSFAGPAGLVQ